MVLRPKLDMYCKCSDKCKKPTVCAEKVCAVTLDGDFINAFVGDFDELNAKSIKAETVTADEVIVSVPPGAPKPTLEFLTAAPPPAATSPELALPVFGVPFGGFSAVPGQAQEPTVTGSNSAGIIEVFSGIGAGTVLKATYGGGGFPSSSAQLVNFSLQGIDLASEGYALPALPQVVDSTNEFFSVLFPDDIQSNPTKWGYEVKTLTIG